MESTKEKIATKKVSRRSKTDKRNRIIMSVICGMMVLMQVIGLVAGM